MLNHLKKEILQWISCNSLDLLRIDWIYCFYNEILVSSASLVFVHGFTENAGIFMICTPFYGISLFVLDRVELYTSGWKRRKLCGICDLLSFAWILRFVVFSLDLVEFNSRIHERIHQKAAIVLNRDQLQGMCENEIFCRKMKPPHAHVYLSWLNIV